MTEVIAAAQGTIQGLFGPQYGPSAWVLAKSLAGIVMVLVPLLLTVLYYQLVERWVIGWIQVRKGPNRVGWFGLLQPIADAVKLLMKERIVPTGASKGLFLLAPIIAVAPALGVWAVVPFAPGWVIANVDAGLLVVLAMTSMGVYGIIIAGWASNSKYAFLGAESILWLLAKIAVFMFLFLWVRASFPRYRYDQIMRLGWKIFIPVTLVWIVFLAAMMQTRFAPLFH